MAEKIAKSKGASFFAAASDYRKLDIEKKAVLIADLADSKNLSGFSRRYFL
jgi:hypothetical protein